MNIVKKKTSIPFVDLLEDCDRWEINVDGQHGVCALVDMMPRLVPAGTADPDAFGKGIDGTWGRWGYLPRTPTADGAIVQAARTSTGQGLKSEKEDKGLVRYLYRHRHGTPFEMVTFKFYQVLPIFVARQLVRHRMSSINEFSGRYAEVKDRFWFPNSGEVRKQGAANKQGGEESLDVISADLFLRSLDEGTAADMANYRLALENGMSKELARVGLGLNLYTEWYFELDLRNILQLLSLRQDSHAQKEIRVYADAMYQLIKPLVPTAVAAYDDYDPNRGGLLLSSLDVEAFSYTTPVNHVFTNARETREFAVKARRLGNLGIAADAEQHAKRLEANKA